MGSRWGVVAGASIAASQMARGQRDAENRRKAYSRSVYRLAAEKPMGKPRIRRKKLLGE